ncbi:MAG: histidine kinase [Muribaculaceae bacterium]|nr:histidine kinase [Muribaculaceae bacterium]
MKHRYLKYIIIGLCAVVLSSAPVCMAFIYTQEELGGSIFWLMVPFTILTLGELILNRWVLIPRFLDKGRYGLYATVVVIVAYFVNIGAVWVRFVLGDLLHLSHIMESPFGIWIWVESVPSCMVGVLLLAGMALWVLYDRQVEQNEREKRTRRLIEEKTRELREGIDMHEVGEMLEEARGLVCKDAVGANSKIRILSDYLRSKLYGIRGEFAKRSGTRREEVMRESKATDFLIQRRYRGMRHLSLLLMFAVISFGLLFRDPESPSFEKDRIVTAILSFIIMTGLLYLNIFVVFPAFVKRGKVRLYGYCLFGLMAAIGVMMYGLGYREEDIYNEYGIKVPGFVLPMLIAGNLTTFFFMFAGSASIVLLKENMKGRWRLRHIETEAARIEFETLQNQINPHFILNVLNNAGVMSYDEPEEALATLRGLQSFLEYMLRETGRGSTTIGEEASFLREYLVMERSSGHQLDLGMRLEEGVEGKHIPPLLLIPFVENAVKFSSGVPQGRTIMIEFGLKEEWIQFVCLNPIGRRGDRDTGGLGLENTRRRLEILYGENFRMSTDRDGDDFKVELLIPELR